MYPSVYLRKGKDESLRRFHPWVFSGAIHHMDEGIAEGDVVRVVAPGGETLAVGHFQVGSIAVRVLRFGEGAVGPELWRSRLQAALAMRRCLGLVDRPGCGTFRLVHGEGDGLPGLVVDVYGGTAVMQAHSVGMHICRDEVAGALLEVMGGRIGSIYYKSETTLPFKAALGQQDGFIHGRTGDDVAVEDGLRFHVDWARGQKTGFFIDQRENRRLLEGYSAGRTVLNMFCYTGGFSVYALRGGAALVRSVDSSARAVEVAKANVELNFPGDSRHEAISEDAFRFLDSGSDAYDVIVLDPPAFAKHRSALHNALKGYTRLNLKALGRIARGGILFTFSCSQAVTKDQFRAAVFTAVAQSGRNASILHQLHQAPDHPVNIYHPEGEYLKGLVLHVE